MDSVCPYRKEGRLTCPILIFRARKLTWHVNEIPDDRASNASELSS